MQWLNYHHLYYFWMVAKEGGLLPAARLLRLTHPTLSTQINALEESFGVPLFQREGRRLILTEAGRRVLRYADEIFKLGEELQATVRYGLSSRASRLDVGVADVVPKLVVHRVLKPVMDLPNPVRLVCYEESHDRLISELSLHNLDVVITDAPLPPGAGMKAFNHLLGECGLSFFAAKALLERFPQPFPYILAEAPVLLPLEGSSLRRLLEQWFEEQNVSPHVVAEFEDSALLKDFGGDGTGVFMAPTVVEDEVMKQFGVLLLGRVPSIREKFYAITTDRRIKNPAVAAICTVARDELFQSDRRY